MGLQTHLGQVFNKIPSINNNIDVGIQEIYIVKSFNMKNFNPCRAEKIKTPRLLLISSQPDYLIWAFGRNSHI